MSTRKKIFVILLFIIQLGLIWPVYTIFRNVKPLILGLPLSFAWVVTMLISAFFLLLWYYLTDTNENSSSGTTNHS